MEMRTNFISCAPGWRGAARGYILVCVCTGACVFLSVCGVHVCVLSVSERIWIHVSVTESAIIAEERILLIGGSRKLVYVCPGCVVVPRTVMIL